MTVGKQAALPVAHSFDVYAGNALALHAQAFGRGVGKVDDAALLVRAAVVDAHDDAFADVLARDFHDSTERDGLVRRRHGEHIEGFTVGRDLAMMPGAVPRGRTALLERLRGASFDRCRGTGNEKKRQKDG